MRIDTPADLGRHIRDQRRQQGHTQAALAATAQVSRRWLSELEGGKPSAGIGLVFRVLAALDLALLTESGTAIRGGFDLDDYLRQFVRDPLHDDPADRADRAGQP